MLKVFISYAHEDALYLDELHTHLEPLRGSLIETWTDRDIRAGIDWNSEIWTAMSVSHLVVVLVSASYLASTFGMRELHAALARQREGTARLVPILVRDCLWTNSPLKDFQVLCADDPIRSNRPHRDDRDALWARVARETKAIALSIVAPKPSPVVVPPPPAIVVPKGPKPGDIKINPKDGLEYVWLPPGSFRMGASDGDAEARDNETPAHDVTITKGFWLGKSPVTQAAYQRVIGKAPSYFKGPNLPVESVNWHDATAYAEAVGMRLPTEAEWEYAARAGTTTSRYGELEQIAWFGGNSGGKTHDVATRDPNKFGLYDMLGNVLEWTADNYGKYSAEAQVDPKGPPGGDHKSLRGGSWGGDASYARASRRYGYRPSDRYLDYGFRCAGE